MKWIFKFNFHLFFNRDIWKVRKSIFYCSISHILCLKIKFDMTQMELIKIAWCNVVMSWILYFFWNRKKETVISWPRKRIDLPSHALSEAELIVFFFFKSVPRGAWWDRAIMIMILYWLPERATYGAYVDVDIRTERIERAEPFDRHRGLTDVSHFLPLTRNAVISQKNPQNRSASTHPVLRVTPFTNRFLFKVHFKCSLTNLYICTRDQNSTF